MDPQVQMKTGLGATTTQVPSNTNAQWAVQAKKLVTQDGDGRLLTSVGGDSNTGTAVSMAQENMILAMIGQPVPLSLDSQIPGFELVPASGESMASVSVHQEREVEADGRRPTPLILSNRKSWAIRYRWRVVGRTPEFVVGTWVLGVRMMRLDECASNVKECAALRREIALVRTHDHDYDEGIRIEAGSVVDGFYRLTAWIDLVVPAPGCAPISGVAEVPFVRLVGASL